MSKPLPDVLPVRTSERVAFELRAAEPAEGVEPHYEWVAVRQIGERLTAVISAVDYVEMRAIRRMDDELARIDRLIELARVEVWHQRASIGGAGVIPEIHVYSLAGKVTALSSVGADPFGVAPAASQL